MSERRIAVFGCKSTTRFMLDAVLERAPVSLLVTISPELAARNAVADYEDLRAYAAEKGIDCLVAADYGLKAPEDATAIGEKGVDIAFVIGWQRLIPSTVLEGLSVGAFGMHGSAEDLPKGRGRSPMNWSLIEGRTEFHTNLFRYDAGVDSGAVLDSFTFHVRPEDTAETMHFKNALAMKRLVYRNLDDLLRGEVKLRPQGDATPTYYPKRTPDDGIIDWRTDLVEIERFIRAVAPPFDGAFTFIDGKKLFIRRAAVFEDDSVDYGQKDLPAGTILEVFPNGKWLVRCLGGILLVHESGPTDTVSAGAVCVSPADMIRAFPRNPRGHYDMEA